LDHLLRAQRPVLQLDTHSGGVEIAEAAKKALAEEIIEGLVEQRGREATAGFELVGAAYAFVLSRRFSAMISLASSIDRSRVVDGGSERSSVKNCPTSPAYRTGRACRSSGRMLSPLRASLRAVLIAIDQPLGRPPYTIVT
jgi:hypothetical protein